MNSHTEQDALPMVLFGSRQNSVQSNQRRPLPQSSAATLPAPETSKPRPQGSVASHHGDLSDHTQRKFTRRFADPKQEAEYDSFSLQDTAFRMAVMFAGVALLALANAGRMHIEGESSVDQVALSYAFLGTAVASAVFMYHAGRQNRSVVGLDLGGLLGGVATTGTGMVATFLAHVNSEDECGDTDVSCMEGAAHRASTLATTITACLLVLFASGMRKFPFFAVCAVVVDATAVALFVVLRDSRAHLWFLFALVLLTVVCAVVSVERDAFLRREYMHYSDGLARGEHFKRKLLKTRHQKQRVVQYLVHEIWGPLQNLVPATSGALDLLEAIVEGDESNSDTDPDAREDNAQEGGEPEKQSKGEGEGDGDGGAEGDAAPPPPQQAEQAKPKGGGQTKATKGGKAKARQDKHRSGADAGLLESLKRMVTVAHTAAVAIAHVLDDTMDMQNLEGGNFRFNTQPFDIKDMFMPVCQSVLSRFEDKGVKLGLDVQQSVQQLRLVGDLRRLNQVITNFLNNALKFTPKGGEVLLSIRSLGSNLAPPLPSERIRVAVSDTGIGMSPEQQQRAFKAWSQVKSHKDEAFSFGLGLALSKDFVKRGHNGTVGAHSPGDLNAGTTMFFVIDFPLSTSPVAAQPILHVPNVPGSPGGVAAAAEAAASESSVAVAQQPVTLKRVEDGRVDVLVVDDSPITRRLMARMLTTLGVTFEDISNGKLAVQALKENGFKIVLMDQEMPVMDGPEATQAIRRFNNTIPIVGLTSNSLLEQRRAFELSGATEVLSKPISKAAMQNVLMKYRVLQ